MDLQYACSAMFVQAFEGAIENQPRGAASRVPE
jgi:hypothetical protein